MEQVFKFAQGEVSGPEQIEKIMDSEFMQKALDRFNEMFLAFKAAKDRQNAIQS